MKKNVKKNPGNCEYKQQPQKDNARNNTVHKKKNRKKLDEKKSELLCCLDKFNQNCKFLENCCTAVLQLAPLHMQLLSGFGKRPLALHLVDCVCKN